MVRFVISTVLFFCLTSTFAQSPAFRLYVYAKDCQGIGTCDGKGIMKIQGGNPPYQVTFQSSAINDSTDLVCEGVYSATAVDNNQQSSQFTFIVGSPSSSYIKTKGQPPVDTLYENAVEVCDVRYTEIDSIRITGYQWKGADSVQVTWTVYQQSNYTTVFNKTYAYPTAGLCRFILYMYCSGTSRSSGDHVRGVDEVIVPDRALSITLPQNDNNASGIYPNPFSNTIVVLSSKEGRVNIADINGKLIYQGCVGAGKTNIDTSSFLSGAYIVSVENADKVEKVLLIK